MKFKLFFCLFTLSFLLTLLVSCGECTHEFSEWETIKEATCTEKGNKIARCSLCESVKNEDIEKAEHSEIILERIEATCSSTGMTNGVKCNICGKTLVSQEEIPMLEHVPSIIKGISPTCDNEGLTDGIKCEKCNKTILVQDNLSKTGHAFTDGVCSNCGIDFFTENLQYTLIDDNFSYKVSLGDCKEETIVIPSNYKGLPVTLIEATAFNDGNFKEIVIPNSILTIEKGAFKGCSNLEKITIPFVGKSADASGKEALFGYIFGDTEYYGSYKAKQTAPSKYVNATTYMEYYIPSSLTNVILTGNLTFGAFSRCKNLSSITLPSTITEIPNYSFRECVSLTSIFIPENVNEIRGYAFAESSSIVEFIVSPNNGTYKSINGNIYSKDGSIFVFYADGKSDTSFTVAEGVIEIGRFAFYGNTKLTEIILPESLNKINYFSFESCLSLTSIVIPPNVSFIDEYAFSHSEKLQSIFLPKELLFVGEGAFWRISTGAIIYCAAESENSNWDEQWNPDNCTIVWNYKE